MPDKVKVAIHVAPFTKTMCAEQGVTIPEYVMLNRIPCKGESISWEHKGVSLIVKNVTHYVGSVGDEPQAIVRTA